MKQFVGILAVLLFSQVTLAKSVNYRELALKWQAMLGGQKNSVRIQSARSGTINGGGASGMHCANLDTKEVSVRLLDMYEMTELWNLNPLNTQPRSEDEAFNLLADKLSEHFWVPHGPSKADLKVTMKKSFREFIDGAKFLSPGQDINPIDDAHTPIDDPKCNLVQIAMFYNESQLLIDTDLWNQMSWLDRAALIGHEIIYLQGRLNGETDSINTRKFVSYLFSTTGLTPIGLGAPTDKAQIMRCSAARFDNLDVIVADFFAFEGLTANGEPDSHFVFRSLNGRATLFRTHFDWKISLDEFMQGSPGTTVELDLKIDTFPRTKNFLLLSDKQYDTDPEIIRSLSYFDQNGVLVGGPWVLGCARVEPPGPKPGPMAR